MRPWFERHPGRLECELESFHEHFDDVEIERQPPADSEVVVSCTARVGERELRLRVEYPDSFPHLRPHVLAPDDRLPRHQNPVGKNLCLLDRSTRAWRPSQTAAEHIVEQLPKLLEILDRAAEDRVDLEVPQGEPLSAFLNYQSGGLVLLPPALLDLDEGARRGSGRIVPLAAYPLAADRALRGGVLELTAETDGTHSVVAHADERLEAQLGGRPIAFRWLRLDLTLENTPESGTADALFAKAEEVDSGWIAPRYESVPNGELAITGLVFREEVGLNDFQDSWTFIVSLRQVGAPSRYLARGERFVQDDLLARVRPLEPLAGKTVALVGLGALGAPVAIELARAQVGTLRLLDFDSHELAASVRWPFGVDAAGWAKTQFISEFVERNFPFTRVEHFNHLIGAPLRFGDRQEPEILDSFLGDAEILVDATAERGVNHFLSDVARELEIPQVYVWGTEGGWGGVVARAIPGETACWFCLKLRLADHSIEPPPLDPDVARATVQPRGCAAHTYIAAGFDLSPLVSQTARLVAQTLLRGADDAYPDGDEDVMILALRSSDGRPITPQWHGHRLEPHPECRVCNPQ